MSKVKLCAADFGMVEVSKKAFFATIGQLNVHPVSGQERYDAVKGYFSRWKTPDGRILGGSVGGTYLSETLFMVTHEFHEKHRDAINTIREQEQLSKPEQPDLFAA